jgi:hypothetical protein
MWRIESPRLGTLLLDESAMAFLKKLRMDLRRAERWW